jgi:hypothetical protein
VTDVDLTNKLRKEVTRDSSSIFSVRPDVRKTCHEAAFRIETLKYALNELLNDCINFDGGKLSDCKMQQAMAALKDV